MPRFANLIEKAFQGRGAARASVEMAEELILAGLAPPKDSAPKFRNKTTPADRAAKKRRNKPSKEDREKAHNEKKAAEKELKDRQREYAQRNRAVPYIAATRQEDTVRGTARGYDEEEEEIAPNEKPTKNERSRYYSRSKVQADARTSMMERVQATIKAAKLLYRLGDKLDVRIGPFGVEVRNKQRGRQNWVKGGVYAFLAGSSRATENEANPWIRGGKYAPTKILPGRVHDVIEALIERNAEAARDLVGNVNEITIEAFEESMTALTRESVLQGIVLGAGGPGNFTTEHQTMFQELVGVQLQYLASFVDELRQDVAEGRTIDARTFNRAAQYAGVAYSAYTQAQRQSVSNELNADNQGDEEGGFERRVLSADENCDDCIAFAEMGWQPIGTLPSIGDSKCGDHCRCQFEYMDAGAEEGPAEAPHEDVGEAEPVDDDVSIESDNWSSKFTQPDTQPPPHDEQPSTPWEDASDTQPADTPAEQGEVAPEEGQAAEDEDDDDAEDDAPAEPDDIAAAYEAEEEEEEPAEKAVPPSEPQVAEGPVEEADEDEDEVETEDGEEGEFEDDGDQDGDGEEDDENVDEKSDDGQDADAQDEDSDQDEDPDDADDYEDDDEGTEPDDNVDKDVDKTIEQTKDVENEGSIANESQGSG